MNCCGQSNQPKSQNQTQQVNKTNSFFSLLHWGFMLAIVGYLLTKIFK
jgi:hypothetical protein